MSLNTIASQPYLSAFKPLGQSQKFPTRRAVPESLSVDRQCTQL
jgi:hypothetical protein